MELFISRAVKNKLQNKHNVSVSEVNECLENWDGRWVEDTRVKNKTNPPTYFFIAETNAGRTLKVVLMYDEKNKEIIIKTTFAPTKKQIAFFEKHV